MELKGERIRCLGRKEEGDEEFVGDLRLTWEALDTPSHSSTTCKRFRIHHPSQTTIECIFRVTLLLMDFSPVTKIDLLALQTIYQRRYMIIKSDFLSLSKRVEGASKIISSGGPAGAEHQGGEKLCPVLDQPRRPACQCLDGGGGDPVLNAAVSVWIRGLPAYQCLH